MPRHNQLPVLKIKYRMPGKTFRTKLTLSGDVSNPPSGQIMTVRKVSREELNGTGQFFRPFRDNDPESIHLRKLVKV